MNNTTTPLINSDSSSPRNVGDIVWSCVMTIFACTWVAVHPNIPAISDTDVVIALRRTGLMVCGFIAPEIIILWAMKQWYGARKIGQHYKKQGWTTTHGFFLQMGGFMLYTEGEAQGPLTLEDLETLYRNGKIQWPKITEAEIQDKSKGDALSKGIATLQTSWFLVQCIVRGSTGLVITELELLTLAFASLNAVTYFFWWNKPMDVRYPHPVHSGSITRDLGSVDIGIQAHHTLSDPVHYVSDLRLIEAGLNAVPNVLQTPHLPALPPLHDLQYPSNSNSSFTDEMYENPRHDVGPDNIDVDSRGEPVGSPFHQLFWHVKFATLLTKLPIFVSPATRGLKYVVHAFQGKILNPDRVSTFHAMAFAPHTHTFFWMTVACSVLGSAFGSIHCIALSFQFLSHQEQVLWRISSLVITCGPILIGLLSNSFPVVRARFWEAKGTWEGYVLRPWSWLFWLLIMVFQINVLVFSVVLYITARLVLLVQACVALRALSSGALQGMEWTSLVPHF